MNSLISREHLIQFLRDDLDCNEDIYEKLIIHLSKHLEDIKNANKEDSKVLRDIAHKAKTGCHSFGALELFSNLVELEINAKANNNDVIQNNLLPHLLTLIDPTLDEIRITAKFFFEEVKKSA